MLRAFKLAGCQDCGRRPPEIPFEELACHHRDPTTKVRTGSRSLTKTADGLLGHDSASELLAELAKCDVLCHACHRARHRESAPLEQLALFYGTGRAWYLNGD